MKNSTVKTREQSWEFPVNPLIGTFSVVDKATKKVLREYNVAGLPESIRQRLEVQGACTILQQRKSGESGEAALALMDLHFANWQEGKFTLDRQAPLTVPAWLAGAVMSKYGIAFDVALASIEKKKAGSDSESWAAFVESMKPHRPAASAGDSIDL